MATNRKRNPSPTLADRLAAGGSFVSVPRVSPPDRRRVAPPVRATYASSPVDTNKESALREKKALTEAYRRRQRQNRQTRWGSKLWA